MVYNIII